MIIRKNEAKSFPLFACHGGTGTLWCREILGDYARPSAGLTFVHEDLLQPGVGIGTHRHTGDEELYLVLEGSGRMTVDGQEFDIGPGDACITRDGQTHSLVNRGNVPMRLIVVGVKTDSTS